MIKFKICFREKDEINIKELDQECVVLRKQALNYQKQLEEEGNNNCFDVLGTRY